MHYSWFHRCNTFFFFKQSCFTNICNNNSWTQNLTYLLSILTQVDTSACSNSNDLVSVVVVKFRRKGAFFNWFFFSTFDVVNHTVGESALWAVSSAISVKFSMMITSVKLYIFTLVSNSVIQMHLQGHRIMKLTTKNILSSFFKCAVLV